MESVNEIKEALSARSRTATLDELRSEGRKKVRLIRAEHVAAMVTEAVHAAIEQSGLIDPKDAERLVEKSRVEFRSILKEREQEAQHTHEIEQKLAEQEAECEALKRTIAELEQRVGKGGAAAAPSLAGMPGNDLLMSLVSEMATLKANLMHEQSHGKAAPAGGGGGGGDFSAALDKLTGTLNDRLEKLGKKMGISSAVEGSDTVDFGGMFKDTGKALESNMENIQVKQKAGGGIAANLARLKKLKGGG